MKKVLVIEDNKELRENVMELLELGGYDVTVAEDGRKGVETAVQLLPDLILCDVMIPQLNGHEVFKILKAGFRTSFIPFVFLTSAVEKKEVEAAMAAGADAYLGKPFTERDLLDTVTRCIGIQDTA